MRRIRVFPTLLLKGSKGLYKTERFKKSRYIGDPINAVRIFNEKEVDEICLLDIAATREGRPPDIESVGEIAAEAFVPMSYGGGITTVQQMKEILYQGVEKVILNSAALDSQVLITDGARVFGSSSIVASIDVRRSRLRKRPYVYRTGENRRSRVDPAMHARRMEDAGAGELLLQSIDRDGTFTGYDLDLVRSITDAVGIPVIAGSGASSLEDLRKAVLLGGASAVTAGAFFVYKGPHRAVLINFPQPDQLNRAMEGL